MSISSNEFGQQVARALGSGANAARLAKQETAVVEFARQHRRSRLPWVVRSWAGVAALAVASAAIVLVAVMAWRQTDAPQLVAHAPQASLSESLAAGPPQVIDLTDGSRLTVARGAEVRIVEQSTVKVVLVSGRVSVKVAKQHGSDWELFAGPYRIAVVGTQFDVAFDAVSEGFEVRVKEGLVRVFGRDLPQEGLFLREGQVYASDRSTTSDLASSDGLTNALPSESQAGAQSVVPVPSVRHVSAETQKTNATVEAKGTLPMWRQACAAGQYKDAFSAGALEDFQVLLDSSSQAELLQLANCLRYGGRSREAERALLRLRERFPGTTSAVLSSYHLARLFQRAGRKGAAIQWFQTYLEESPRGELAASARAELVHLWVERGNMSRARAAADEYLRFHPSGNFAGQATELLERAVSPK